MVNSKIDLHTNFLNRNVLINFGSVIKAVFMTTLLVVSQRLEDELLRFIKR